MFNLQSSALYVLRRTSGHSVPRGPARAVRARRGRARAALRAFRYGLAELVALASYAVLHVRTPRAIGAPTYGSTPPRSPGPRRSALATPWIGLWSVTGFAVLGAAGAALARDLGLDPRFRGGARRAGPAPS